MLLPTSSILASPPHPFLLHIATVAPAAIPGTNTFLASSTGIGSSFDWNTLATIKTMVGSSSSSSSPVTVATVAAASAMAGLIAGYYYRSVTSCSHRELKTLKVPAVLLKSQYGKELKLAVQLAMEGKLRCIWLHP